LAGLALAVAGVAYADPNDGDVTVNRVSNILKTKVVIQDNKPAGEVVDFVYNDGGCIEYYVASYDNQMYVIPFIAVQMRPNERVVFVDMAPAQFQNIAFFQSSRWPNVFAPQYQQQVYRSFNVNVNSAGNVRNRTTFRQGADINARDRDNVNVGDRDRNANDRNAPGADRDRDPNARDRANRDDNRPSADSRRDDAGRDRNANPPSRDRNPDAKDRDDAKADANAKAPEPPKAGVSPGSERDPKAPMEPKDAKVDPSVKTPPRAGASPPAAGSTPKNPPPAPAKPGDKDKPLAPPPVIPK